MDLPSLRDFTCARVALGRAGNSLPTAELLKLQLAHARAREAVHSKLDKHLLELDLKSLNRELLFVRTAAPDRATYLRRPDLGRRLNAGSHSLLMSRKAKFDAVLVVADGLCATAVERHAPRLLEACFPLLDPLAWSLAPLVIVEQGRVAIGDEIGECIGATLAVVFIGERPGLSCSDSLGIYLTWNPHPGLTDAARNCISNIHAEGLSYDVAAHKLLFLMTESRRRKISGIELKEDAKSLERQLGSE